MTLPALPIDAVLPRLVAALREQPNVVLRAPTGAGKTTRVPPAIWKAGLASEGQIIMLQPRRVAARAAARRMCAEQGCRLGDEIGYQVRFDQQVGPRTRIQVVTEGILLRRLQDDPFLERGAVVIFDEFHERSLNSDLALGMVRRVQQTVRPDLKLVVMSATLDPRPIADYLGGCPIVESEGRLHPVEVRYLKQADPRPLHIAAADAVGQILSQTDGDVLVFLPGVREIFRTATQLKETAGRHHLAVLPLYGDLSAEQQDTVLAPSDRRKVVLATNVAETSITIEGIAAVIDTGLVRQLQFDASLGLDRLLVQPISKASADQRAGRAGRTRPGVCLRLWTEAAHRARTDRDEPEIHRTDLAGAVLQLRCWGEREVLNFPWFERPGESAVEQAHCLLVRLGALAQDEITSVGQQMVRLPVHPRLARLLIEGQRRHIAPRAALAAAFLSERPPFQVPQGRRTARHRSQSDVLDRLEAFEEFERSGRTEFDVGTLNRGMARFVLHARDQYLRLWGRREQPAAGNADDALRYALFVAFSDRLAKRREAGSRRGVMVGGKGVRLIEESAVTEAELFVCIDVDSAGSEALVRLASAVDRSWLDEGTRVTVEVEFDPRQERVIARRRTYWDDLLLEQSPAPLPESGQVADLLAQAAAEHWERVFPSDDRDISGYVNRVRCLREWMPELELPLFDDERMKRVLPVLAIGGRSFAELRQAPWLLVLKSQLSHAQQQAVEREAPERLQVPSGSRIALQYESGRPPILAVRIQEVFGWRETPRIAGGRVPVLLHLLAPNMRPRQITDDLRSFWENTYPVVRKELRRRYPKHAWPEDPHTAIAERRPQPKR